MRNKMSFEDYELTFKYERVMESMKWAREIPYLNFPSDWNVKIIPPFCGAVVRFKINKGDANVSVYLDCYDRLGCYGEPYWEIYPSDDDVFRCTMADTATLLTEIENSINQQNKLK